MEKKQHTASSKMMTAKAARMLSIAFILPLVCGCATLYATSQRAEYAGSGERVDGIHGEWDRYPVLFPATEVCLRSEIPYWFTPGRNVYDRAYKRWMWIIGAPLSLVDLPISIVTDVIGMPFDLVGLAVVDENKKEGEYVGKGE